MVGSVDYEPLISLIQQETFRGVHDVDDISDCALKDWFEEKDAASDENFSVPELDGYIKNHIHVSVQEADLKPREMCLF